MTTRALRRQRQPRGADLVAVPAGVASTAERQCGVVTRAQLTAAGLTGRHIAANIDGRRWQAFGRNVVVFDNAPLSPQQREWAAVLLPGKPAALAGLTAVTAAGLRGFEPEDVHIVVRHDTHTLLPPWVRLHESRRFSATDIARGSAPPRTPPARAAVDAATWSPRPRRACAILCASVQQRVTTPARLAAALRVAGPVGHARIMREIVGDISGGGHTLAEIDLGPLAAQAGLSPPRRQVLRRERAGKVRYVDAEFDLPDGTNLAVEIDGAVHLMPESWWDDQDRQNEIVIAGSPVLRFSSLTIRLDQPRVVDQLRRMSHAHAA